MTFWVHIPVYEGSRKHPVRYEPPMPKPVPGRGWPLFLVEQDGFTFRFSSLAELDVCVATLSQKLLPTTRRLSEIDGRGAGPNGHWLSRLPKGTKSWRYREKAVRSLLTARGDFVRETEKR
jgi:hypothetical protein